MRVCHLLRHLVPAALLISPDPPRLAPSAQALRRERDSYRATRKPRAGAFDRYRWRAPPPPFRPERRPTRAARLCSRGASGPTSAFSPPGPGRSALSGEPIHHWRGLCQRSHIHTTPPGVHLPAVGAAPTVGRADTPHSPSVTSSGPHLTLTPHLWGVRDGGVRS